MIAAGILFAALATFTYKTAGDLPIQADVYRPDDNVVRPAILWIHGGALIMGHRGGLRAEQRQRYLDAGFAVVSIDYRLAPETKLPAILEDIQDAYRWLAPRVLSSSTSTRTASPWWDTQPAAT